MTDEPEVILSHEGALARIELNRPRAINALTHAMVREITRALRAWEHDPAVRVVALTGRGERGLCAGGDIVSLYRDATSGDTTAAAQFWADEYRLNAYIARYPKPFVAVMDGVVLGGGIGLSAHASHRIVTERSSLGLPETTIGFVPDVGATWLLSRAPGRLGVSLALTASSVGADDAIAIGLADSRIASASIPHLISALRDGDPDAAIAAVAESAGDSALLRQRSWVDAAFEPDSVSGVLAALAASADEAARVARAVILTKSPTAVAVTHESLRRAASLSTLEQALQQEYRVSLRSLVAHDFAEGVRAQVIDKDRNPRWNPGWDEVVTPEIIEAYFTPSSDTELDFAFPDH